MRRALEEVAAIAYEGDYESIAHLGRGSWYPFEREARNLIEQAIVALKPAARAGRWCRGAEWWIRIGRAEEGKDWHFDLDEAKAAETGEAAHPVWASVFYFGRPGGATLITDQVAAGGRIDQGLTPERARAAVAVRPRPNQYLLFPGNLYHCVLPGTPHASKRRITLLINWWDRIPDMYVNRAGDPAELAPLACIRDVGLGRREARELRIARGVELDQLLDDAGR